MPSIKNQMRGIERLLRKPDLDPRVRASKEQQLAELQAKQEALSRTEREKRLATKYHKARKIALLLPCIEHRSLPSPPCHHPTPPLMPLMPLMDPAGSIF
jgi:hypothetical protein